MRAATARDRREGRRDWPWTLDELRAVDGFVAFVPKTWEVLVRQRGNTRWRAIARAQGATRKEIRSGQSSMQSMRGIVMIMQKGLIKRVFADPVFPKLLYRVELP